MHRKIEKGMAMIFVPVLIIVIQALPVLYFLYWGYSNHKLSEYYIWLKLKFSKNNKFTSNVFLPQVPLIHPHNPPLKGPRRPSL